MARFVVYGGTGITGKRIVQRLLEQGHRARVVTRDPRKGDALADLGAEIVAGDINDRKSIRGSAADCDYAIHCASGMLQVADDGTRPYAAALRNVLDEVARPALTKFVWTGTTAVYGDRPGIVIEESEPVSVMNAMGAATREMEEIIERVGSEHGIPWVILRVPGIAAPERATLWLLVREGRFAIFGNGEAVTPLIHVDDLAEACILAALRGVPGSYYNLNTDEVMTTREFWTYSAERMGVAPPPVIPDEALSEQQRPMRVLAMNVSNAKAKRELGLALRYPSHRAIADAILATLPPA